MWRFGCSPTTTLVPGIRLKRTDFLSFQYSQKDPKGPQTAAGTSRFSPGCHQRIPAIPSCTSFQLTGRGLRALGSWSCGSVESHSKTAQLQSELCQGDFGPSFRRSYKNDPRTWYSGAVGMAATLGIKQGYLFGPTKDWSFFWVDFLEPWNPPGILTGSDSLSIYPLVN